MKEYILAIDQGTTGTTSVLISSQDFSFIDKVTQEFPQIFPIPGQVEHDLNDIWDSVKNTIIQLLNRNNIKSNQLACIGITNQRETACAFDKEGHPLANAIVWQDRRTASLCQDLKNQGKEEYIKRKTGLTIDPYFSATKWNWYLKHHSLIKRTLTTDKIHFGTIDTFLLYKLTNNKIFATEPSNASRTLLMDLSTGDWDQELLNLFQIPRNFLPEIMDSFSLFGKTAGLGFLADGIPITGILGDQQAALFGQAGTNIGDAKCTYGTGAFILLNLGSEIHYSNRGLLTTVAYQYKKKLVYALEGSAYIAGAAVQWLRDSLNLFHNSKEVEDFAKKVKNLEETKHLLFLPFFTGMGSPYWLPEAKGAIIGLTRDTNKYHISRACLEGIALSIHDLYQAFISDQDLSIKSLNVDGGASANDLLIQIQANFSEIPIVRPKIIETTAYGAALGAALGSGLLDIEKIKNFWKDEQTFYPQKNEGQYYALKRAKWKEIIQRLYMNGQGLEPPPF